MSCLSERRGRLSKTSQCWFGEGWIEEDISGIPSCPCSLVKNLIGFWSDEEKNVMIERTAAVERDQKKPECPKRTHEVILNRDVAFFCQGSEY